MQRSGRRRESTLISHLQPQVCTRSRPCQVPRLMRSRIFSSSFLAFPDTCLPSAFSPFVCSDPLRTNFLVQSGNDLSLSARSGQHWNFLRNNCSKTPGTCNLSHDPAPERTPLCVHFLNKGWCTRERCAFPHGANAQCLP